MTERVIDDRVHSVDVREGLSERVIDRQVVECLHGRISRGTKPGTTGPTCGGHVIATFGASTMCGRSARSGCGSGMMSASRAAMYSLPMHASSMDATEESEGDVNMQGVALETACA